MVLSESWRVTWPAWRQRNGRWLQYALPLLLVLLQLYVLLPSFGLSWALIDEANMITGASSYCSGSDIRLVEPGRFRPLYWLLQWMLPCWLTGVGTGGFRLFQILKYVAVGLFLFGIVKRITGSSWAGFCAGVMFAFAPTIFGAWITLGPVEPWVAFFQAGSIFFLLSALEAGENARSSLRRRWSWFALSAAFAVGNYFIKETAICFAAIALVIALFMWSRPNRSILIAYLGVNLLTAAAIFHFLVFRLQTGGYASQYNTSIVGQIDILWIHVRGYWRLLDQDFGLLLPLAIATGIVLFIYDLVTRRRLSMPLRWLCIVGAWFAVLFAIQVPWPQALGKYMLPIAVPASILTGIVLGCLINLRCSIGLKQRPGRLLIAGLIIVFIAGALWSLRVLPSLRKEIADTIPVRQNHHAIARSIAKLMPRDGNYFFAAPYAAAEWPQAMGLMIAFLYNRTGFSIEFLKLTPDQEHKHGDIVSLCSLEGPNPGPFTTKQVIDFFGGDLRFPPAVSTSVSGDEWLFFQVDWGPLAEQRLEAQDILTSGLATAEEEVYAHYDLGEAYEANGQITRAIREYRLAADGGAKDALMAIERLCMIEGGKYRGERGCPKPDAREAYDLKMLEDFEGRREKAFFQWGPNNAKHAVLTHALETGTVYRGKQAERFDVLYAEYENEKTTDYWMLNVNVPLTRETRISWMTRGVRGVGMVMLVKFAGEHYEMMWDKGSDLNRRYQLEEWRAGDLDWRVNVSGDVYAWAKKAAREKGWKTDGMVIVCVGTYASVLQQNDVVIDNVQAWFKIDLVAKKKAVIEKVLASGSASAEEKAKARRELDELGAAYEKEGQMEQAIKEYRLAADRGVSGALESVERLCVIEGGRYRGERGCPKPDAREAYDIKMLEDFEGRKEKVFFQWGPSNAKHDALTHNLETKNVYRGKQAEHLAVRYAGYEEGKTTEHWMLAVSVPLTNETHVSWMTRGTYEAGMAMVVRFDGEHHVVLWDGGSDLDRRYQWEEWRAGDMDWQTHVSEDVHAWAKRMAHENGWETERMRIVRVGLPAVTLHQNDLVIDNVQAWHAK